MEHDQSSYFCRGPAPEGPTLVTGLQQMCKNLPLVRMTQRRIRRYIPGRSFHLSRMLFCRLDRRIEGRISRTPALIHVVR